MNTSETEQIGRIAQALQGLGYRAQVLDDQIVTSVGGIKAGVRWYEPGSVQFATGVSAVPDTFGLLQVNEFNSQYRFGTLYKQGANLFLQSNFLVDTNVDDLSEQLDSMVTIFEGLATEVRQAIGKVEETAQTTPEGSAPEPLID